MLEDIEGILLIDCNCYVFYFFGCEWVENSAGE